MTQPAPFSLKLRTNTDYACRLALIQLVFPQLSSLRPTAARASPELIRQVFQNPNLNKQACSTISDLVEELSHP